MATVSCFITVRVKNSVKEIMKCWLVLALLWWRNNASDSRITEEEEEGVCGLHEDSWRNWRKSGKPGYGNWASGKEFNPWSVQREAAVDYIHRRKWGVQIPLEHFLCHVQGGWERQINKKKYFLCCCLDCVKSENKRRTCVKTKLPHFL